MVVYPLLLGSGSAVPTQALTVAPVPHPAMGLHVLLPSCSLETPDLQTICTCWDDTQCSEHLPPSTIVGSVSPRHASPCHLFPLLEQVSRPLLPLGASGIRSDSVQNNSLAWFIRVEPTLGACHQQAKPRCLLSLFSFIHHARPLRQSFCFVKDKSGAQGGYSCMATE